MLMLKRGYFFTLDILMALFILVAVFLTIWSSASTQTHVSQPYFLAQDIMNLLQSTKNKDFSAEPGVISLISNRNITDYELTVLEQMALFYYEDTVIGPLGSKTEVLENFTNTILSNVTPPQYSFEFSIDNRVLYSQLNPLSKEQNDSESLVSSRAIVSVVYNKLDLSPPYLAEVRVWQ